MKGIKFRFKPFMGWNLVSSLIFFLFFLSSGHAQEEILGWVGPDLGKMKPTLQYQAAGYSAEEVPGQHTDFRMTEHRGFFLLPVHQSPKSDSSLSLNLRAQDIHTSAILPDSGESFPDALWDVRMGAQFRRRFENGWIGGVSGAFGSASDKPFASSEETLLYLNLFTRIPQGKRNAWLLFLNYSRTREFLGNVPIPGVGYWYEPSDRARLVIGIPFAFIDLRPIPEVSFSLAYFIVRTVHARVTYRPIRPLRVYGGFEWKNESYFRAERRDEKDRLFYYQKALFAGIQWDLRRQMFLDLSGGYAFDRFYFEGRNYDDRGRNRVDIEDGPFIALRGGVRF